MDSTMEIVRHGAVHLPPGGALALQSSASAAPTLAVVVCTRLSSVLWPGRHRSSAPSAVPRSLEPYASFLVARVELGEAIARLVPVLMRLQSVQGGSAPKPPSCHTSSSSCSTGMERAGHFSSRRVASERCLP